MELSIELFLIDNLLMDLLMLRLAAAIGGLKLRPWLAIVIALIGALYALLSMTAMPVLNSLPCKLALCAVASIPLMHSWRDALRAVLALLAAACLMGGLLLGLCLMLGGTLSGGALIGTVPLRIALFGAAGVWMLPRAVRSFLTAFRNRNKQVLLRVVLDDRTLDIKAIADSGNLLTEPISGKPVIIIDRSLMPETKGGRPVPYATLDGDGLLYAIRPRLVQAYVGGWHAIDALIAASVVQINGTQAIIDSALLPNGRRKSDVQTHVDVVQEMVFTPADAPQKTGHVYPFGGDAPSAVSGGGGTDLDCTPEGGGTDGQKCVD